MAKVKDRRKYLGSGAEAKVYAVGNKYVDRVMHVNAGWKDKNKPLVRILRKLAKSSQKTKYLCPIYGVTLRKFTGKNSWMQKRYTHTLTIRMARAKHTKRSSGAAFNGDFRDNVRQECEAVGIPAPTDWHSYNVMQMGRRLVRVDYFPWYMATTPDWMRENRKLNLDYAESESKSLS